MVKYARKGDEVSIFPMGKFPSDWEEITEEQYNALESNQEEKENGEIAGTIGEAKRIEAIKIFADKPIKYRVHIQDIGWTEFVPNGCEAGTTGQSKRIEAIEIVTDGTPMIAQAHIQDIGWQAEVVGTTIKIGTEGRALRLEALKLQYV